MYAEALDQLGPQFDESNAHSEPVQHGCPQHGVERVDAEAARLTANVA